MKRIEKLAISNRGEVAVRIIRAAKELGLSTVLLHSEADVESLAYRIADERVLLGPSDAKESYLHIERNILAAKSVGADAIHPGFGFLSENADFARACQENRIIFVGPSAESIQLFGDKISAKNLVMKSGGPVIPGYQGEDQSTERLIQEAEKIGFPVMVKATGGGGGRGLRVIRNREEGATIIEGARREAKNAFNSEKVFLEKYLDRAKHIEVQIFGDAAGNVFHLFERECSVQRRHQKVIEEAPAAKLDGILRARILAVAREVAQAARYKGAGTVEFLVQDSDFYFMEMNTRLQVEHPVTEMILGVDLVKAQILTAEGQALLWDQDDLCPRGHAIECRIYAEDPYAKGIPSTGRLGPTYFPMGPGRRFEVGFESGDLITTNYDSMIAKVVVHDETRARAIRKMSDTLRDTIIFGVRTNIPYLIAMLQHPDFVEGKMTTQFIEQHFRDGLQSKESDPDLEYLAQQAMALLGSESTLSTERIPNPWLRANTDNKQ